MAEPLGIPCPNCGGAKGYVTDTRARGEWISRRRECRDCGHRYSTRESYTTKRKQVGSEPTLKDVMLAITRLDKRMRDQSKARRKQPLPAVWTVPKPAPAWCDQCDGPEQHNCQSRFCPLRKMA